jgi:hypothetical protein
VATLLDSSSIRTIFPQPLSSSFNQQVAPACLRFAVKFFAPNGRRAEGARAAWSWNILLGLRGSSASSGLFFFLTSGKRCGEDTCVNTESNFQNNPVGPERGDRLLIILAICIDRSLVYGKRSNIGLLLKQAGCVFVRAVTLVVVSSSCLC